MLQLHRSERADLLVDALAAVVDVPTDDPFARELVAVHSRGIERWLAQELSTRLGVSAGRGDGVCANVEFPFPSRVVGRALAAAGGVDPDADPWSPDRLVWPLVEVIDAHIEEGWLATLRGHLGGAPEQSDPVRRGRRFSAGRHIADLFDRYAVHRPAMVRAWADGRDVDGSGAPLDPTAAWQPRLWRLLRDRVGIASPAERLVGAVERLGGGLEVSDLPPRLSLFGLTALPASYFAVLAALATTREVHLFLLHPSPVLWQRVAGQLTATARPPMRREDDPTRELPHHPLLASWGRDARELQLVVTAATTAASGPGRAGSQDGAWPRTPDDHRPVDPARDGPVSRHGPHAPHGPEPTSLLARIQADVRADRPPPGPPPPGQPDGRSPLAADDRSLQIHACHGRTRQVEVLRDAILHLLATDPTLEPRDIVVKCPDIETFAPIVHAVFGAHVAVDAPTTAAVEPAPTTDALGLTPTPDGAARLPDLRVRLADRSIRQTNPLLRVVAELLSLADGRLTASEVLDLASREPVRRRFRFDDVALARLEGWVAQAAIRWGIDAGHRAVYGLAGLAANTWRAGLDRLLLGVTMADEDQRLVGGTVPLDDVEGGDVDLAGRFAEFVDRLAAVLATLSPPQPVAAWRQAIAGAADALTATGEPDRWQRLQLHRLLDDIVAEATLDRVVSPIELSLPEVRTLLEDRLRGRPSRANHRTGDLTVCTLVPMRSVPHRVVCLLGMDDGCFPRRTAADGDDLIDRDPHVGDRDPRTEDRQLLLDALLAATQHLVITYTGRDERTNEPRPPAVPIGELLDTIDRTVRTEDGIAARRQVVIDHPLQPFDPDNFRPGALLGQRPWGFDPTALAGARTRARARDAPPAAPFLAAPLPAPEGDDVVPLDELVRFLVHPAKTFLRRRLGVTLPSPAEEPSDVIPVELDQLDRFAVGDRLLAASLAGVDPNRWAAAERARGTLPPGRLADPHLQEVGDTVAALLEVAGEHTDPRADRSSLEVDLVLPDGRSLLGTVADLVGDVLLSVRYARVAPKHRLAAWVRLLAASAAHPERPLAAVTVGRCRNPSSRTKVVAAVRVPPLAASARDRHRCALDHLTRIVDLYERGLRAPLPLYCKTSAAYAEAYAAGGDPVDAAYRAWTTNRYPNEDREPEHVLVLSGVVPFARVLQEPPATDEAGDGWAADETTRFGRYARRLWEPLLAREEGEDR